MSITGLQRCEGGELANVRWHGAHRVDISEGARRDQFSVKNQLHTVTEEHIILAKRLESCHGGLHESQ